MFPRVAFSHLNNEWHSVVCMSSEITRNDEHFTFAIHVKRDLTCGSV